MDGKNTANFWAIPEIFMAALIGGGIVLSAMGKIPMLGFGALRIPAAVLGVVMIAFGAAVFVSKARRSVEKGGILGKISRLPHYSGTAFVCAGAFLVYGNACLAVFLPVAAIALHAAGKLAETAKKSAKTGK